MMKRLIHPALKATFLAWVFFSLPAIANGTAVPKEIGPAIHASAPPIISSGAAAKSQALTKTNRQHRDSGKNKDLLVAAAGAALFVAFFWRQFLLLIILFWAAFRSRKTSGVQ